MKNKKNLIEIAQHKVQTSIDDIMAIQRGETPLIKTGVDWLDDMLLGGIRPKTVLTIAAKSGIGKSYFSQKITTSMFNADLNPSCGQTILLRCNFEMSVQTIVLRRISESLNRSIKSILSREFNVEEAPIVNDILDFEANPNIYYLENSVTADEFLVNVKSFLEAHKDKSQIVVEIDHLALLRGLNPNQEINTLLNHVNSLKSEYNVSFILISQLNRNLEQREMDGNPLSAFPRMSDLYYSSAISNLSDLVVVLQKPTVDTYGLVRGLDNDYCKYYYLSDYMTTPNDEFTSFFASGDFIFYHVLKKRHDIAFDKRDLFIKALSFVKEEKAKSEITSNNIVRPKDFMDLLD